MFGSAKATAKSTADVLGFIRRSGRAYGPTPFGFERMRDVLVENAKAQRTLSVMKSMRIQKKSYQGIADELNRKEIKPSRSKKWYVSSVKAVLGSRIQSEVA